MPGANVLWTQAKSDSFLTHNFTPGSFTSLYFDLPITYYTILNWRHSRHVLCHTHMDTHNSTSHSGTTLNDFSSTSTEGFMEFNCCQGTTSTARVSPKSHSHPLCSDATGSALFYSCSAGSPNPTPWTGLPSLWRLLVLELVPPIQKNNFIKGMSVEECFFPTHCPPKPFKIWLTHSHT